MGIFFSGFLARRPPTTTPPPPLTPSTAQGRTGGVPCSHSTIRSRGAAAWARQASKSERGQATKQPKQRKKVGNFFLVATQNAFFGPGSRLTHPTTSFPWAMCYVYYVCWLGPGPLLPARVCAMWACMYGVFLHVIGMQRYCVYECMCEHLLHAAPSFPLFLKARLARVRLICARCYASWRYVDLTICCANFDLLTIAPYHLATGSFCASRSFSLCGKTFPPHSALRREKPFRARKHPTGSYLFVQLAISSLNEGTTEATAARRVGMTSAGLSAAEGRRIKRRKREEQ